MAYTYSKFIPFGSISLNRLNFKGTGVITGTAHIDSVPASCRVFLYTADGTFIDYTRTKDDGEFTFSQLEEGNYRIVVEDDMQKDKNPQVLYTTVT